MLSGYGDGRDVVVLGLARGGVPVGAEIAAALNATLDVFVVRKLGVPQWPELAMGAIASGGGLVVNENVLRSAQVTDAQLHAVIVAETRELVRRDAAYRDGAPPPDLRAQTVILADDGIATGASMIAAVRAVRDAGAGHVVVAAPVGSLSARRRLCDEADEVVIAVIPRRFDAVGQVYADFREFTDDEVRNVLRR